MSERIPLPQWFPSIARTVANPSTLFPHQAEQLPETPLSGLRLPSCVVCIVSALALASRRLALTSHLSRSPLTSHLSHSPLTSRTHHSPLALTSHLSLTLTSRRLAAPLNPQPATHHLRARNTFRTRNTCPSNSRSLAPAILAPIARR
jgi:hypothetical protein